MYSDFRFMYICMYVRTRIIPRGQELRQLVFDVQTPVLRSAPRMFGLLAALRSKASPTVMSFGMFAEESYYFYG